jgi:RNA polymerase sigma factor (sigma-70 family)
MTVTTERPTNGAKPDVEALYRKEHDGLVRYATRIAGSRDVAEDAVQETFVRLLSNPTEERVTGALASATTRGEALREHTHRGRQRPAGDAIDRLAVTAPTSDDGDGRVPCMGDPAIVAKVEAALAALPERDAAAVRMHYLEGRPVSAVAQELQVNPRTVYTAINRSLARFREMGFTLDEDTSDERTASADVAAALAALTDRQRDAVRLRYVEGLTFREIGTRTGTTENSALTSVKRATARLQKSGLLPEAWVPPGTKRPDAGPVRRRGRSMAERVAATKELFPDWRTSLPGGAKIRKALGLNSDSIAWKVKKQLEIDAGVVVAPSAPVGVPVVSEAWLSWADQLVTCMFVHTDESTARHPVTFRSMPAAKREVTGLLVEQGHRPDGPWVDTAGVDESMRKFKPAEVAR